MAPPLRPRPPPRPPAPPSSPRSRTDGSDVPGAAPAPRVPALAHRRRAHDPGHDLAVLLDREQGAEQWDAAHEVGGAIDRVDVPADGAGPGFGAVLLADQAVVGIRGGDQAPDG